MRGFIIIVLVLVMTVFIIQNISPVTVSFFTLSFTMPGAFLLSATLCAGIVIGMLIPSGGRRNN